MTDGTHRYTARFDLPADNEGVGVVSLYYYGFADDLTHGVLHPDPPEWNNAFDTQYGIVHSVAHSPLAVVQTLRDTYGYTVVEMTKREITYTDL